MKVTKEGTVWERGQPELVGATFVGTPKQEDTKIKVAAKNARKDVLHGIAVDIVDGEFML